MEVLIRHQETSVVPTVRLVVSEPSSFGLNPGERGAEREPAERHDVLQSCSRGHHVDLVQADVSEPALLQVPRQAQASKAYARKADRMPTFC
jgi:hypothetical protein